MDGLSVQAVRDWAGDVGVGKGRPYSEGSAVVGAYRRAERGEVGGSVKGTRARPYRVTATVAGGRVRAAVCSCPVGADGKCKHAAAVLLAYAEEPDRFPDVEAAERELIGRSADDLRRLVSHLLASAPELLPLVAVPMPGHVRGPVAADVFRQRALEVVRAARVNDDWTEEEVADGLAPLLSLAGDYRAAGDAAAADAVAAGVADALQETGLATERMRDVLAEPSVWARVTPVDRPTGDPPF
jgi:uncharacterized Zn finger protein